METSAPIVEKVQVSVESSPVEPKPQVENTDQTSSKKNTLSRQVEVTLEDYLPPLPAAAAPQAQEVAPTKKAPPAERQGNEIVVVTSSRDSVSPVQRKLNRDFDDPGKLPQRPHTVSD